METIRYRPMLTEKIGEAGGYYVLSNLGLLDEHTCKNLYLAGRIDDTWDIEVHIPGEATLTEKPSTLFNK